MIKTYKNGNDFYKENKDFLLKNIYTEVFFRLDSPLLLKTNKFEYALQASNENSKLLVLKKEPYNILFFGDFELVPELIDYLVDNRFELKDYLSPIDLGDKIKEYFSTKNIQYDLTLGMDFMEAHEKCDIDPKEVESATLDDLDEVFDLTNRFIKDCGLNSVHTKEKLKEKIETYRLIRKDDKIVSMAHLYENSSKDYKISMVYTRDEYRGMGYAKEVCGYILNEIIDKGYYATLNVDINNPISNHVYKSIGFKRLFSQGIYSLKK